ncbi:SRPBCC family protein [Streptomyces melanogenes]|uniref:SRPBCC family protein n=1 Tax=Streptomyces melanogenes TaxID=67326 RepID=UPI00378E02C1
MNQPGDPGQVRLDRQDVWAGLLRKAANAVPFVAGIVECVVVERSENGLVREVVFQSGERVREKVVFEPEWRVAFHRADDRVRWVIHNDIGEDEAGELTLTFRAELDLHDDAEEDRVAASMRTGYPAAMQTTLALTREAVAARSA